MTELTNQAQQQQTSEKKDLTYWNSQWCSNKVGFHRLTMNHGKTIDMKAVLDSKHQVIGIECAQVGIETFFQENNIKYQRSYLFIIFDLFT
ncbi:unnamed protein product [Rotaria socialis]|uniref:Uncharacterized protein n=1 Tax=Rotaria socialis TaxID=392032 RepID=A0A818ITZ8_9BILA|nr:unnamed protein product [Rotaria socialis]